MLAALAWTGCGGDDEDGQATAPARTVTETETVTETRTVTVPTGTARGGETVACGDVGFEPNTDAGAFGIRATGVPCEVARRVAAAAEGAGGRAYEAEGFDCAGVRREDGLTRVEWTCERDGAEVTFTSS